MDHVNELELQWLRKKTLLVGSTVFLHITVHFDGGCDANLDCSRARRGPAGFGKLAPRLVRVRGEGV